MASNDTHHDDLHLTTSFSSTVNLDEDSKAAGGDVHDENESIAKEKLIKKINTLLNDFNFHPKWILDKNAFEADAMTVYTIICNEMLETMKESDDSEIKHNALELLSKRLAQIFLAIHMNKLEKADIYLLETQEFLKVCKEKCYFSLCYISGIHRVLTGLEALLATLSIQCSLTKLELLASQLDCFHTNKLDTLGEVGLLAMQTTFVGLFHRKHYQDQAKLCRSMIKLEPTCGMWYMSLHLVLKFERNSVWRCEGPGKEEVDLIVKAVELCPENALVRISLCDTIASVVRERGAAWRGVESFGSERVFYSSAAIVEFLNKETREVLVLDPTSVTTNISVGQIFSSVLPKTFRDLPFAKLCIKRALLFHPNSSKANARMGIFCLMVDNDPVKAVKYFEHAYEADPRNIIAMLELLQTYMANLNSNRDKIDELFTKEFKNLKPSDSMLPRLHFVKGIYSFLLGDFSGAIVSWDLTVKSSDSGIENFKKLDYGIFRYHWPKDKISLSQVVTQLTLAHTRGGPSSLKKILDVLIPELEKSRQQGQGSRGGYRGSRGHGGGGARGGSYRGRNEGFGGWNSSWRDQDGFFYFDGASGDFKYHRREYQHQSEAPKMSTEPTNHYKTLGLELKASKAEIKMAYRQMCLKHHPDKNGHLVGKERDANLESMKKINVAYEVLVK